MTRSRETFVYSEFGEQATRMHVFTAIIERCQQTGYFVGYAPNFPGAHTQAETLDELYANLQEVINLLLEDGEPELETEFVATQM